jgi:hypothetical protein
MYIQLYKGLIRNNKGNEMGKPKEPAKKKKPKKDKSAMNAKMLAISIIFVMLFVSFAVIITTQEGTNLSKDMVFNKDPEETGTYYGNVKNINIALSNVKIKIKDSSSDSTNTTEELKNNLILETEGNFNCTYFDRNSNNQLDSADEFVVHNAADGDYIRVHLKSSNTELAFYIFSDPF